MGRGRTSVASRVAEGFSACQIAVSVSEMGVCPRFRAPGSIRASRPQPGRRQRTCRRKGRSGSDMIGTGKRERGKSFSALAANFAEIVLGLF